MKLDIENCSPAEAAARALEWSAERIEKLIRLEGMPFCSSDLLILAESLRVCERSKEKQRSDEIIEMMPNMVMTGATQCPVCGQYDVHSHTPADIIIYRNGIKEGRRMHAFQGPHDDVAQQSHRDGLDDASVVKPVEDQQPDYEYLGRLYHWLRFHSWVEKSDECISIHFGPGINQMMPEILDDAIADQMQYPKVENKP